jgi:hypothetical protein
VERFGEQLIPVQTLAAAETGFGLWLALRQYRDD